MADISRPYKSRGISISEAAKDSTKEALLLVWTLLELVLFIYMAQKALWHSELRSKMFVRSAEWMLITSVWDYALNFYSLEELGLRPRKSDDIGNFSLAALHLALIIYVTGWLLGWVHHPNALDFFLSKPGYILMAALQQFALQSYLFVRLERLLDGSTCGAILMAATIFALHHWPNRELFTIAFAGGLVSCFFFKERQNLYALAMAHGIVGSAIAAFWQINMRVGSGY